MRRGVLDQVGSPSAVRASRTPKRFWLWSKYRPSGPLPAPGHTNPRPSHTPLLFSWLQNASGYQSRWGVFFLSLIFTHKMCISRTKAAMIEPLVPGNFLPICQGILPPPSSSLLKRYFSEDAPCGHKQRRPSVMVWM